MRTSFLRPLLVLTVLIAAFVLVAVFSDRSHDRSPTGTHTTAVVAADKAAGRLADASARMRTAEDFAAAVTGALYSYDTTIVEWSSWRAAILDVAGTPAGSLGARDIERMLPDAGQWAQMADIKQQATFSVGSTYVPTLWTDTQAQHPELPKGAVGLTVTGVQDVSWSGGSSHVPVATTLLLLCPPATQQCVVSRVPAQVAR